jgi:hypothetical protein
MIFPTNVTHYSHCKKEKKLGLGLIQLNFRTDFASKKQLKPFMKRFPGLLKFPKVPKLPKSFSFKSFKEEKIPPTPHEVSIQDRIFITQLCPIVKAKNLIRFWYEDKDTNFKDWRTVEPHLIGHMNTKEANIVLVAWFHPTQTEMLNGHMAGWRTYILENISKIQLLEQKFTRTRPRYNPRDSRMKTIFCATDRA